MRGRRVLHLTEYWRAGGTEAVVAAILSGLAGRGHEAALATLDADPSAEAPPGVPFHRLSSGPPWPAVAGRVARLLRREAFDTLHTHQAAADLAGAASTLLARGVVLVSTRHDLLPFRSRRGFRGTVFRLLDRDAVRRSVRTVCVSEAVRVFLSTREGVDPRRLDVIPNGVDTGRFLPLAPEERRRGREALGLPAGAIVAGFLGRLEMAKGADRLPAIWREVRRRIPDAVLAVAGEGSLRPSLDGIPGIAPLGRIAELPRFLPLLDLLLVPSRSEGFSLAVVEAASCGVAAVATATGGLAETVADGESGILVPEGDGDAGMADAVVALARDPEARRRLGEAARGRAVARFDLDRMIDAYDRLYRGITPSGGRG